MSIKSTHFCHMFDTGVMILNSILGLQMNFILKSYITAEKVMHLIYKIWSDETHTISARKVWNISYNFYPDIL